MILNNFEYSDMSNPSEFKVKPKIKLTFTFILSKLDIDQFQICTYPSGKSFLCPVKGGKSSMSIILNNLIKFLSMDEVLQLRELNKDI
jgi:hypothetical protein